MEQIRRALDALDADALRHAAHGLKGAAANFDARAVAGAARGLEEMGREERFADYYIAWRRRSIETDRLMAFLRTLIV